MNTPLMIDDQTASAILEAATMFRSQASTLMHMMAEKFGFNPNTLDGLTRDIYSRNYFQKGELTKEWSFYFHGSHCCLENSGTGQVVEVHYIHPPEFGYLDGFFFYNYLRTTPGFKALAGRFDSYIQVWEAIQWMANRGILAHVELDATTRVLAR